MHDGWTALAYAAMNGFCSIVEVLHKHGADINTKDRLQRNPFHWAARFDNTRVAKKLLDLGVNY